MKLAKIYIKRYVLGILGLVSLLSVVFITAAPHSATAQAITETAAVKINWSTGSAQTVSNPAIFTIDYESNNCDAPIGGTLHRAAFGTASTEDAVLGTDNEDFTLLTTHFNQDTSSASGANADTCDYTLRVTASLHCTFTVTIGGTQVISVAKTTQGNLPSQGTARIRGMASSDTSLFTPAVDDLGGASDGILEFVNSSGAAVGITDTNGVLAATAVATDCNSPTRASGFTVINAESFGSLDLSLNLMPLSNCQPDGPAGEVSIPAGSPQRFVAVRPDTTCTYTLAVSHATERDVNEFNAVRSLCGVVGILYETNSGGDLQTAPLAVLRDSDSDLRISVTSVGGFVSRESTGRNIAQITLFISASCPQTSTVNFRYELLDSTPSGLRDTNIRATIVKASTSDDSCVASPRTVTIPGATVEKINSIEEVAVQIITRPRLGRTCEYVITYPLVVGPLTLAAEPGNNFRSGAGTATTIARPTTNAIPTADGNLDGRITESSIILRNSASVNFIYESRRIPIKVSANFPDDAVFTTNDIVDYRITVTGACGEFSEIVAQALGGQGSFRSIRAYPGTTLVWDPSLRDLISSTSQVSTSLYEIEPVVIIDNQPVSCTVQVEEVNTPVGCTIIGQSRRDVTFSEGLPAFSFDFDHSCTGSGTPTGTGNDGSGRGITA